LQPSLLRGRLIFFPLAMRLAAMVACLAALQLGAVASAASPLPLSKPSSEGFSESRLKRMNDFARELTHAGGYLGAVTLVARNGRLVDWSAYGHRDLAKTAPMRPDTIFRIYSM